MIQVRRVPYVAWPAWFYGPNGESGIFERAEDIPEGWLDSPDAHGKDLDKKPEPKQEPVPLTRAQVTDALKQRGVQFQRNASTVSLYNKLVEAVEAES